MKRTLDFLLALILLLPALAVSAAFAAVIRIESPGSPFFRQTRVGRDGRPFALYKLRSMYSGTASVASHHVGENRITRAGRIIRRFKIDELPQVINVLLGDMSFVGPRPSLANQHELIAERTVCGVLALRPGITGPAQLAGIDMSTPRELAIADAAYLGAWSLRRDLTILAGTVVKGRGDAARRSTAAPGPDGSTE